MVACTSSTARRDAVVDPADPDPLVVGGRKPMLEQSLAFRAYAAKQLKVPRKQLDGAFYDPVSAAQRPHSRGRAWEIEVFDERDPSRRVQGWVTPDGIVITPEQNLGILFVEAGVWTRPPTQSLDVLANLLVEDIVWAWGGGQASSGKLLLERDGSGTLVFSYNDFSGAYGRGGGGGGAPVERWWDVTIELTRDHQARVAKKIDTGSVPKPTPNG